MESNFFFFFFEIANLETEILICDLSSTGMFDSRRESDCSQIQ